MAAFDSKRTPANYPVRVLFRLLRYDLRSTPVNGKLSCKEFLVPPRLYILSKCYAARSLYVSSSVLGSTHVRTETF